MAGRRSFESYLKQKEKIAYKKFIPLQEENQEAFLKRGETDARAPMCWLDLQIWSTTIAVGASRGVRSSVSDTALIKQSDPGFICRNVDLFSAKRFHTNALKTYLHLMSEKYPDNGSNSGINVELIISGKTTDHGTLVLNRLNKIKTELLVNCLQTFFSPYGDCGIYWTSNDEDGLFLNNKSEDVYKAVLKLGPQASVLLRHRDMAILGTLAKIVGINQNQIKIICSQ